MSCFYAHNDGAYVLGALAPGERRAYEAHLADCESCAAAVRQLAGLPGLLGRVDPQVLEAPADDPPETLLPALLDEVRRTRRRRTGRRLAVAAAAVLLAGGAAGGVGVALHDGPAPTPSATRAMTPLTQAPVHATLAFQSVPWGTRLSLACTYDAPAGYAQPVSYALVVHTRDGRTEQVATWRALPGRTTRLTATAAADRADIASVELRTADGHPVLRLAG